MAFSTKLFQTRIFKTTNFSRLSSFIAPKRPTIKVVEEGGKPAPGREVTDEFSSEYIPVQVQPAWHQNKLGYKLERLDCLRRRQVINIPEFYAGSIVAVTVADEFGPDHATRFVGRCLWKDGFGLRCKFVLRNVIDGEGVEVMHHLYSPLIQNIEVLRLEKWIDTDLRYLRNAESEICTIDPNMTAEAPVPVTQKLPLYEGKVRLGDKVFWTWKYDRAWPRPFNAYIEEHLVEENRIERERIRSQHSFRKYDICRHYDIREIKDGIISEMKAHKMRLKKIKKSTTWKPENQSVEA